MRALINEQQLAAGGAGGAAGTLLTADHPWSWLAFACQRRARLNMQFN